MKKQISFSETEDAYRFSCSSQRQVFEIKKHDLKFDSKKLFETFFRDLTEKPEFEFDEFPDGDKTAKHIYDTVVEIMTGIQNDIEESWFALASDTEQEAGQIHEEAGLL